MRLRLSLLTLALSAGFALPALPALAQEGGAPRPAAPASAPASAPIKSAGIEAENRPVAQVRIVGLKRIPELLVRNQLRIKPGDPYLGAVVTQDIKRVTELGRFDRVAAIVTQDAKGGVVLTYHVIELPMLETVEIVGADLFKSDRSGSAAQYEKLREKIRLRPGDPIDRFLLDQARAEMVRAYEDKGCYEAKVTVDEEALKTGHLRLLVSEGPRLRVRDIRYEGNKAFSAAVLDHEVKSGVYWLVFQNGWLDREKLELDAASVRDYYRNRGWLDAQVGRRIDVSRAQRSAVCTFVVDEGPRYAVKEVQINFVDRESGRPKPPGSEHVIPEEEISDNLTLHPGDPYEKVKVDQSVKNIEDLYGRLGHLGNDQGNSANICRVDRVYDPDKKSVTLVVTISENTPTKVGKVDVIGNGSTQNKVVLRELDGMMPGRLFDRTRFEATKERLASTPYFADSSITLLGQDGDEMRDAVVQVKEKSTGSISFGVGATSDSGFSGNVDYTQRNFDISDYPRNVDDLFSGHAFRGAGQTFNINLSPGTQVSTYSVSFTEPAFIDTDNWFSAAGNYYTRQYNEWNETRTGVNLGVGRRFGRLWSVGANAQLETVDIDNLVASAPTDAFAYAGTTTSTVLGVNITRSTVDSIMQPGRGMKDTLSVDRYGALGGDSRFTKISFTHQHFWTLEQDFLGRKTTIGFRGQIGYIPEGVEAPFFYQFYAGGQRTLRGFDFRGIGPFGIRADSGTRSDSAVGGTWMALASMEYSKPLYEDVVRWVLFTDQGTVKDRVGFEDWRVAVGTGLRIKIPFLGQAPLALDFAIPLKKAEGDQTKVFSFDFSMPLQ